MTLDELNDLLTQLRLVATDHRTIEAKRARTALPNTTHETVSAFSNTDGGLLLLGVDENGGAFSVTGVDDASHVMSELQSVCEQMEPPLRPAIDLIPHPDGVVVAAWILPAPRHQRPCHRRADGPYVSSFIRVGDADQHLSETEVSAMLAGRTSEDLTRVAAQAQARLDQHATADFVSSVRKSTPRNVAVSDAELLRRWGVTVEDGADAADDGAPQLTLAGLLTLGEQPQSHTAAASVTYRRLPKSTDPPGTRYAGTHLEGSVGELLDATMDRLAADLDTVQVMRGAGLLDELDVPREALREVLSNALVHRSFAGSQRDATVLVEVSDDAVVTTSPGGIYFGADPETLGLDVIAGLRNLTLVRIAERLRTPSGLRIVERQASGIAAADEACRVAGTMPALFVDMPTTFQVTLLRRTIDPLPAREQLALAGITRSRENERLLSTLMRLDAIRTQLGSSSLDRIVFDARLTARALRVPLEDAAAELRRLEDAGVLIRIRMRHAPAWALRPMSHDVAQTPKTATEATTGQAPLTSSVPQRSRSDRMPVLLAAIAAAPSGELSTKGIGLAIGVASPSSRRRWIVKAVEAGLIASTTENAFDPTTAYTLTATGRARHEEFVRRS